MYICKDTLDAFLVEHTTPHCPNIRAWCDDRYTVMKELSEMDVIPIHKKFHKNGWTVNIFAERMPNGRLSVSNFTALNGQLGCVWVRKNDPVFDCYWLGTSSWDDFSSFAEACMDVLVYFYASRIGYHVC